MLERRDALGGAWHDRRDSFYLKTPNFSLMLQGLTYDGLESDAFLRCDPSLTSPATIHSGSPRRYS